MSPFGALSRYGAGRWCHLNLLDSDQVKFEAFCTQWFQSQTKLPKKANILSLQDGRELIFVSKLDIDEI